MEAYRKTANAMMRRPVVKSEVIELMRDHQSQLTGKLKELQDYAQSHNIPVIPHETVVFLQFFLSVLSPKKILEVGTAIGFSSLVMAESCPAARIITMERYEAMLVEARKNLSPYDQIQLLEGEALENLAVLPETNFDFIFMDSAKTQYVKFLPLVLEKLSDKGVLMIDDVFQAGDVTRALADIPRRERNIVKGLNKLFDATLDVPELTASLVPLGDGLLLIKKASSWVYEK